MKKFLLFVLLLALIVPAQSQIVVSDKLYRVPLVQNETDTIPGTESGGIGAGGAGWLYIGDNDVEISFTAQDSVNFYFAIDMADTGYASATGSSAKSVGFRTYTRVTGADTLATLTDEASPKGFYGKVLRDRFAKTDLIPGAKYIRIRVIATNDNDTFSSSAAGRTVSLRIRQFKYAGL